MFNLSKGNRLVRENEIEFSTYPIRECTPTKKELKAHGEAHGGEVRKLFNTSSKDYRDPEIKDCCPLLPSSDARLVEGTREFDQSPFVIGDGLALQGFKIETWEKAFSV